jgi:geranyl-CoA carboxylase alpha subunit
MRAHYSKILIANRGEIACRVIRTARAMGYRTVAIASDADTEALHAWMADETVAIGPAPATQSYLLVEKVLDAARRTRADAIHPGYGFLSENANFAQAVIDAGLVWIGPPPAAIAAMGDKASSKKRMIRAGVPCIPGYQGDAQDDATLIDEAERIGRPLMVKASAGGGGKGMRIVREGESVLEAIASARSEALSAFGSDLLILERALEDARHVEIQIFADELGNVVHLGERDCSVQRRHQKVLEEAPSPAVDPDLRQRMGMAAIAAAKAVGYVGAGTVEFLLGADRSFYFLEMNTRLQVEHAVTEEVYGLDLVEWQLRVAAGEPLPLRQEAIIPTAASMEARLYAEAPASGFLPRTGRIVKLRLPEGDGLRVDHGLREGMQIGAWYDPLLAKLIATGPTREDARRRLIGALRRTFVAGCETNRTFLIECLQSREFAAGRATTAFIGAHFGLAGPAAPPVRPELNTVAALMLGGRGKALQSGTATRRRLKLRTGQEIKDVAIVSSGDSLVLESVGEAPLAAWIAASNETELRYHCDGVDRSCRYAWDGNLLHLSSDDADVEFEDVTFPVAEASGHGGGSQILAPMTGTVTAVLVAAGDTVAKGQPLAILEAMKMEHRITARRAGVIGRLLVRPGDQVTTRALLVELSDAN